jgi:hypothetical protein
MFDNLRELSDAPLYEDDQNQDDLFKDAFSCGTCKQKEKRDFPRHDCPTALPDLCHVDVHSVTARNACHVRTGQDVDLLIRF